MRTVTVSAPGKLMLLGEHSVVYGYPCIVTAVDARLWVTIELKAGQKDVIITPQVKENKFVTEALKIFKKEYWITQTVKVTTKANFSHQVGLGSSSAVTVATIKALSILFNLPLTNKEIFDLSYQVTINIQKLGSGFDVAAAIYGGTIYFISGGKTVELLKIDELPLVVGYSGIKADTPALVKTVKKNYRTQKEKIDKLFKKITQLTKRAKKAILDKNYKDLGLLMTRNHRLLQELGVSIPKLDQMVEASLKAGAYGAKLSGAGGGDCMIALVSPDNRQKVIKAITSVGGRIIQVNNNAEGVRIE